MSGCQNSVCDLYKSKNIWDSEFCMYYVKMNGCTQMRLNTCNRRGRAQNSVCALQTSGFSQMELFCLELGHVTWHVARVLCKLGAWKGWGRDPELM